MRNVTGFLVYLPDELKAAGMARAEQEDLNLSQLIRKAMREYLAEESEQR